MSLLLRIVYPFFAALSIVLPRNKKLWVFGNQKHYTDNTKYFFEYVSAIDEQLTCYWLANDQQELDEVLAAGFKAVKKNSILGFWFSARAGLSFICNGFADINRVLALRSLVISFWHGTPIKKIYLDSHHDLKKLGEHPLAIKLSACLLSFLNKRINFYYASNEFERRLVTGASGIPLVKSLALGAPRFDIIRATKKPSNMPNGKIILYAPTWREDKFADINFKLSEHDYNHLLETLEKEDAYFVVKPHPLTDSNELVRLGLQRSRRILYADELQINDINMLYTASDMLITDLSSSMFDYLILGKPLTLFMPDVAAYLAGDRGIYGEFEAMYRSPNILTKWSQLINAVSLTNTAELPLINDISQEVAAKENTRHAIYIDLMERFYA